MRLGLAAALTALSLIALQGCSQPQPTTEATASTATATVPASTPTSQLAPSPTPFPTSTPLPQPTPTLLPEPTLTPLPTATPVPELTPTPVATRVPTETGSTPTPFDGSSNLEPKELSLTIEPAEPYSGRDARFTIQGLAPWEKITVQFFDPKGQPAEWITESESYLNDDNGNPVTERRLYASGQGRASWLRIGTKDQAGVWKVQITRNDGTTNMTYPVNQLPVTPIGAKTVGIEFHLYQGPVSNTYYTDKVPGALTVDLQNHLRSVADGLREVSGLQGNQTPNIYLVDTLDLLRQVSESTGSSLGFADGYYHSGGDDSGIYMHTDALLTGIQRLLTHEYVHLAVAETIGPVDLPAWLNEGTATYYEYLLNVGGDRANASRNPFYRSIGIAESAAKSGKLLALSGLEIQDDWNSQTEKEVIDLQYAQSHMAVRYLADTYGNTAPIDIMKRMGTGATLHEAFVEIVGIQYSTFEQRFAGWLQSWEDPKRKVAAEYTRALNKLMDDRKSIDDRRTQDLLSAAPAADRVNTKRELLSDAEGLAERVKTLPAPSDLEPLHDAANLFMERFVALLSLELEHQLNQRYVDIVAGTVRAVDTISERRLSARDSGVPPAQRIQLNQGLASEMGELVERLANTTPPTRLEPLHVQGLAFLTTYSSLLDADIEFLNDQSNDKEKKEYLQTVFDIIASADDISDRRAEALQSNSPSAQKIATSQILVSDTESLMRQLESIDPAPALEGIRSQGIAYLRQFAQWLTIELEYFQTEDSVKLIQANAMIPEINIARQDIESVIVEKFEGHPDPEEVNKIAVEVSRTNNLLVRDINAEYKSTPSFQQAKGILAEVIARADGVGQDISDLEFVYNLREP